MKQTWADLEGGESFREYRAYIIHKPEGMESWSAMHQRGKPGAYPPLLYGQTFKEIVKAIDEVCDLMDGVKRERSDVEQTLATWVIECEARCADHGCTDHEPGTWRKSKALPGTMSLGQAIQAMAQHAAVHPRSGPYRLVRTEVVETTTIYTIGDKG